MSKRTVPRPNQDPESNRYKVFLAVRDVGRPVTAAEVKALLPEHKEGTISSALSEYPDRGCMTKISGKPNRYTVTDEQNALMLANTMKPSPQVGLFEQEPDVISILEQPVPEPEVVEPEVIVEPPTPAEVNLAIREVLLVAQEPLDADDLARETGLPLAAVRTELSYMASQEPHSAPHREKIKGKNRERATFHYMKSAKAWAAWRSDHPAKIAG